MKNPIRPAAVLASATLLAGVLALCSCGSSPTEPTPRPRVHRTVTAVLRDSLGEAIEATSLVWIAQFDSAGIVELRYASTDADGECMQVLAEGGWIVATTPGLRAAGASLFVSGPERALADTQVVDLRAHTASRATGIVTLAGRTDHRGTIVNGELGGFAFTDSTGAWALDGFPLGRWWIVSQHLGFKSGIAEATITTPGSTVTVPAMNLIPDP